MSEAPQQLRVPPHSIVAEQSVLGGLMLKPEAMDLVEAHIGEGDFYRKQHRFIFRAMLELSARGIPCDAVTLGDWFAEQGLSELVSGSFLSGLANDTPSAANVEAYAKIVREKSTLRRVIDIASTAMSAAFDNGGESGAVVDEAVRALMDLHRMDQSCEFTMKQAVRLAYDHIVAVHSDPAASMGIPSGLTDLDECLGGFHNSDFIVVGSRPAMGKTAWLLGRARHAALKGFKVGIVSGEQPAIQLGARALSLASNLHATKMRTARFDDEDWPRLTSGIAELRDLPAWILDRSAPTIDEVCRVARRWKQTHGIQILFLDYLQRIQAAGEKRSDRVAAVAMGLKNLARDLDIPVVALAQVKREVELRADKRPHMADLSDSSDIEKEADQVLLLYRDDYYNDESQDAGTAELIVDKNRHGPTGFVRVAFHPPTMRFSDLARVSDYGVTP